MIKRAIFILSTLILIGLAFAGGHQQASASYEKRLSELALPSANRQLFAGQEKLRKFYNKKQDSETDIPSSAIGAYASALEKVLDQPEGYSAALYHALEDYEARVYGEDSTARVQSAGAKAQVELEIIQIAQNKKIIDLLRKIAKE